MLFRILTFTSEPKLVLGPKLTCLEDKGNVHLYPGIRQGKYQDLLRNCFIYLDLNYGSEVSDVTLDAIENGQLLFGLESTVHRHYYKDLPTVYTSLEELEQDFRQLLQQPEFYPKSLESQKEVLKLAEREEILAFLLDWRGKKMQFTPLTYGGLEPNGVDVAQASRALMLR